MLKQRLIDSELRAVEAKREAAAAVAVEAEREAAMRRGTGEVADIAAEAIAQLGDHVRASRSLQLRLRSTEERLGLKVHAFNGGTQPQTLPQQPQWAGESPNPPPSHPQQQPAAQSDALNSTMSMLASLDYEAIKSALLSGEADVPILMQALRWRLTKPARRQRKTALAQYIQNDLLDASVVDSVLSGRADVDPVRASRLERTQPAQSRCPARAASPRRLLVHYSASFGCARPMRQCRSRPSG